MSRKINPMETGDPSLRECAALLTDIRAAASPEDALIRQKRYEKWLSRDAWRVATEAVPLVAGFDPEQWPPAGVDATVIQGFEAAMLDVLEKEDAEIAVVTPAEAVAWARRAGVSLPDEFARLFEFIQGVLPRDEAPIEASLGQSAERELLLGAALTLVTRFPEECRDAQGFFDGGRIADRILEKAALWFPLEPPRATRDEIAAMLERWLT